MAVYSLSDTRARLAELLTRAESGENITVTRHARPIAVIVGHDRWMKQTAQQAIVDARGLGARMDAARGEPLPAFPSDPGYDYEAHVAEIRRNRDSAHQGGAVARDRSASQDHSASQNHSGTS